MNKRTITSIIILAILLVAAGFFIFSDLKSTDSNNDEENHSQSATTTATNSSQNEIAGGIIEQLPEAPVPSLDRNFVIPEIYGEEIIKNTMEQYNSLVSALEENPELRNEWLQLALLRNSIDDYEGAEEIWIYVSKVWPLDHVAFGNLGGLYMDYLKDYGKAEENLIAALERRPDNLQYFQNLYNLYRFRLERSADALSLLFSGQNAFPDEIFFPVRIAEHYRDTGDKTNARKYFEEVIVLAQKLEFSDIKAYAEGELEAP